LSGKFIFSPTPCPYCVLRQAQGGDNIPDMVRSTQLA